MKKRILRFFYAFWAISLFASAFVQAQTRTDVYAITNAQIVTVSGRPIARGTVVVRDGLIESVGETVRVPGDAQVIDGNGLTVYPGFFDTLTNLGFGAPRPATPGQGAPAAPQTPQTQQQQAQSNSNYPDGLQPETVAGREIRAGDAQFETQRNAGFTTVLTVNNTGIFQGQSAVINLAGDSVSGIIIKSPVAQHVTFRTLGGGRYPTSLMGTFSALRQMLLDAQRLAEMKRMYAANPRGMKRPDADASLEALFPVLAGQMPVVFNANTEREIFRVLDLANEFKLKAIIAGGQEAGRPAVTERLKAQNVPVLLSLDFPRRTAAASTEADPEPLQLLRLREEAPKTAARLQQAGVKFAFQSGGMRNVADFITNAGKAVENGLQQDAAIRAMTLSAAEILGVENQLGSIEPGKIANLVVSRGDIFGKDKRVTHVFVDGRMFEQKEQPRTPAASTAGGGQTTAPGAANIGGTYSVNIEIPGQPLPATMILTQQGSTLTGSLQTQFGTTQIKEGKITPDGFSYSATVDFQGQTFEIFVKGTVAGNRISGTIESPQGAIPFSGTKTP
jgi:imidazolonepropionase-like amidohydrolase